MDLHPDASVALGRLNPLGRLGKRLDQIARSIDKQADRIVALGPYMADRLQKRGVRLERISIIPVWSRMDEVEPIPREENTLRKSLNLFDKTVVMYSGNMGLAHAFDEVLQAIDRLRHRSDILFMFVGGGPRRAEIERAAKEQGLPNVRFEDSFPRSELSQILTLADIHLITMRSGMGGIVVPGKLYGIMAAGRPAVFVGPEHCETADTIRGAECGLVTRLGDVAALVQAIETLADDPSLQQAMGVLGRDAMILDHERAGCCQAWAVMLEELAPLHPHRTRITPRLSSPETQLPASHAPRPRLRTIRRAQVTERHG
jgi:glycosyltransferase involved in cell wall biosynthesis